MMPSDRSMQYNALSLTVKTCSLHRVLIVTALLAAALGVPVLLWQVVWFSTSQSTNDVHQQSLQSHHQFIVSVSHLPDIPMTSVSSFQLPSNESIDRINQWFPPLEEEKNHDNGYQFSQCEKRSGWPLIHSRITNKNELCTPNVIRSKIKKQTDLILPPSRMVCWQAHGYHGYLSHLCVIRNLYAEISMDTGQITWRLARCIPTKYQKNLGINYFTNITENTAMIEFMHPSLQHYSKMKIHIGPTEYNVDQYMTLNHSLAISFYGMVINPWHAIADVNAHWMTLHFLSHTVNKDLFDPNQHWAAAYLGGEYRHNTNFEYLYRRLWDTIIFDSKLFKYLQTQSGWRRGRSVLVRIPGVVFPLVHYSGLPWHISRQCPAGVSNRNPAFLQWQSLVHGWMTELVQSNGPNLIEEMCVTHLNRFRLFEIGMGYDSQSQGWKTETDCRSFWKQLYNIHHTKHTQLLFFGDRHTDQRGMEEPCGSSHRCIGNLNQTRDELLVRFGRRFFMIMGNPSVLSLQAQYELLRNTDVLFGMHGAMFAMSQFMNPNRLVFEITTHLAKINSMNMVTSLGIHYADFQCDNCPGNIDDELNITLLMTVFNDAVNQHYSALNS